MYCPKCNQQQASEEMRFCSRCGFPLSGVAQLLANDGLLPVNENATAASRRKKIISESAFLTLIAWALAFGALLFVDFGGPFEVFALVATIVFFIVGLIGLFRFTYGLLFVKDSPKAEKQPRDRSIPAPLAQSALPPAHSIPVTDYPRRVHTKEIVQPPSITENTTKLLDENISDRSE
jgi:hypothetical protein